MQEAFAATPGRPVPLDGSVPLTPRADRALARARRFARDDGAEVVTTAHVLSAILDVEGTAGQVLRGLRVDVDALRVAVERPSAERHAEGPDAAAQPISATVVCPHCGAGLHGNVVAEPVAAASADGPRSVVAFACTSCGRLLGIAPA